MKNWSSHWKKSTNPRKQRKRVFKAPLHARSKFMAAHLSEELQKKYHVRNMRVRKGDRVKILRGSFKGSTGAIDRVDLKLLRIFVNGVAATKRDGTKAAYPIHPSKVIVMEVDTTDRRRIGELKKQ